MNANNPYQDAVTRVRGRGCRCPLMWDGEKVKPAGGCEKAEDRKDMGCPLDGEVDPRPKAP